MRTRNRTKQKNAEGNVIAGLKKNSAILQTLVVQGKVVTVNQAIATFQGRIDAITQAQLARVAYADAVKQQDAQLASTDAFVGSLVTTLGGMYAGEPNQLADFGLAPRKVTPLTVAQKQEAAAKRKATRQARNTLGKKQKAQIKGTVPVAQGAATPAPTTSTPAVTPAGTSPGGAITPHA